MWCSVRDDVEQILITETSLHQRVCELGAWLSSRYAEKEPTLVGVLKGGAMFMMDLIRAMDSHCQVEFMAVSSYEGGTRSTGAVRIVMDLETNIAGRDVVVVEDIIDSGLTLRYMRDYLLAQRPASLCIVALLDKGRERPEGLEVDQIGFRIPDRFVVGYGLDYRERYRNLPYIGVLKESVVAGGS